ncbi:glycosyltransferase [Thalassovita gelatinovora]|uniref:glycosyltransferase n=1 Tax=Thalassovita gelatinovora TaxID=53501 RepID=UPI000A74D530|nr:glycosyltransferase [Thalassovita gelatinovora]QIZ80411.1 hypothetical protein HFZ77_07940 [Thalassovita gelatinovora]
MTVEVQILGLCRWSYPSAPGAFQKEEEGGFETLRQALYDPLRLQLRLFYLEQVVLPSLRAQTDPDFKIILLMGDTLPDPTRSQVLDLIADIPQIKPVFAREGQHHQDVCRDVMVAERDMDVRAVAEFRLDDDDAVSVDFVERTRDFFPKVKGIFRNGGKLALDFNKGFILQTDLSGVKLIPVTTRYWTPGLVLYLRPQAAESLLHFNHAQMWKRIPMLSFPRVPMFLRGAHGENDSSVSYNPHNSEEVWFDKDKLPETMMERFNIPLDRLKMAWDTVLGQE